MYLICDECNRCRSSVKPREDEILLCQDCYVETNEETEDDLEDLL